MSNLKTIRPSTDLIGNTLYQAVRDPSDPRQAVIVSSDRKLMEADFLPMQEHGLIPHPDYVKETEEGPRLLHPPNLPGWSEASLSQFLEGGLAPTTMRGHFNSVQSLIKDYVWLHNPVQLILISITVFLSYLIQIVPAVPIIEVAGPVGSGKSTLFHVLSKICRCGIFSSITTIAGLARARHLNPCTLFLDEPLHDPNHPVILGSYKRGSTRLLAGPDQSFLEQQLFGLTFKVRDHASEAVKDRTIFIDIAPAHHPMPPFLPERESERISRLIDHGLWLSLTQFQNVLDQYERVLKESPFTGRAVEKWAPILAIARIIDSSDTAQDPITPDLEEIMAIQVANQKSERSATDPSMLALSGTLAYLEHHDADLASPSVRVVAGDLAAFVSDYADNEIRPQRLGFLLGTNGILSKTFRTRETSACVRPVCNQYPKTVYKVDLPKLKRALEINGISPEITKEEKE